MGAIVRWCHSRAPILRTNSEQTVGNDTNKGSILHLAYSFGRDREAWNSGSSSRVRLPVVMATGTEGNDVL